MKIIDLFCKAGGASYGMFFANPFATIVGVDIEPQPRYPFDFIQADWNDIDLIEFDFAWASPPCWKYSRTVPLRYRKNHPDLIAPVRHKLLKTGIPYCMENVPCSPLRTSLKLRGDMFGLPVQKERWFETSFFILGPGQIRTKPKYQLISGDVSYKIKRDLMHVEWMNYDEYANSVPPDYSYYILKSYLDQINFMPGATNKINDTISVCGSAPGQNQFLIKRNNHDTRTI